MFVDIGNLLLYLGVTFLISGGGAFFGAYLKEKAKRVATHEDIENVLKEVRETTKAAKEIEAQISDKVWDRQKRWEVKREALFEATKDLGELEDALTNLNSTFKAAKLNAISGADWSTQKAEASKRWTEASNNYHRTNLLVVLVCSKEVEIAFDQIGMFFASAATTIFNQDSEYFTKRLHDTEAAPCPRRVPRSCVSSVSCNCCGTWNE